MIEFMHYYVTETIQEAKTYRDHANKTGNIDVADMRLAIQSKNHNSFTRPLEVSSLRVVAEQRNKDPLAVVETLQKWVDDTTESGGQGVNLQQKTPVACTLPMSQDATKLVAPNVHVYSEELNKKFMDERMRLLKLAKMKAN